MVVKDYVILGFMSLTCMMDCSGQSVFVALQIASSFMADSILLFHLFHRNEWDHPSTVKVHIHVHVHVTELELI